MYALLPAAVKPTRVLLLSRSESSVRMDVRALRAIGMKECIHMTDGQAAIAFLRKEGEIRKSVSTSSVKPFPGNSVDLVVCDENLRDGPAPVFLYALACERGMSSLPVLVLAGSAGSAKELRRADLYVLERPYSLNALEGMAQKAMSPLRPLLRGDALESAATKLSIRLKKERASSVKAAGNRGVKDTPARKSGPLTITDWYNKGVAHLKANELPDAERAFMRVLDGQEDHPEAALGLVRLYRATGNRKRMGRYLLKAAVSCLRQGDIERAKVISDRLPERISKNIYIGEAVACLEEGRGRAAAAAFQDAVRKGGDKTLHQLVARACLQTSRPDESMAKVCDAFEKMGHAATAMSLRRRLLHYTPFAGVEPDTWLDSFPRFKEAVTVASYAAQTWKQAKVY